MSAPSTRVTPTPGCLATLAVPDHVRYGTQSGVETTLHQAGHCALWKAFSGINGLEGPTHLHSTAAAASGETLGLARVHYETGRPCQISACQLQPQATVQMLPNN